MFSPLPRTLAQALRVSTVSAVWTLLASVAAIVVGLTDNSVALIAFGSVGIFDFASDSVLVVHFRAVQQQRSAAHLERVAIRIVAVGLAAVGVVAVGYSVWHLVDRQAAHNSPVSVVLAAVSAVALTALAIGKLRIAGRLPSTALRADAQLTGVGAGLAMITVAGIIATEAFEWWWADPAAALTIGVVAIVLAALTDRHPPDPL